MTRVKICGNQTLADAALAVDAGADAVGVLVGQEHRSDDFVDETRAREIFAALPPFVAAVLVTHHSVTERVVELVEVTGCSTLQLHAEVGAERLFEIRRAIRPVKLIGLVGVRDASAVERARRLAPAVDALILDTVDVAADRVGGTGRTHDWKLSARIVEGVDLPVILAGGLDASNVCDAISRVRPSAVDVNSGVRDSTRRLSRELARKFVLRARAAQSM